MKRPFPKYYENDLQGERVMTSLYMNKDLWHEFKILAARENRPATAIINEIMHEYLKTHKEGNPQHLLTNYTDDEDFLGFPAMSIKTIKKREYLKKMPEDMKLQMKYHLQEWEGMLKENGILD